MEWPLQTRGFALISEPASAEIQGRINAILRDRAGDLWVGGEKGLYRIHGGHCTKLGRAHGLASDSPYVQTIFEDRRGTLWIGTATGLARSDRGSFSMLPAAADLNITALYEDAAGVLWIGTYDTGLARLDGETFTRYTEKDGFFNNGVFQILEDEQALVAKQSPGYLPYQEAGPERFLCWSNLTHHLLAFWERGWPAER